MNDIRRFGRRLLLTRAETSALLVVASLYLVGFTWRYVQKVDEPFDPKVYAKLDSLIAAGGPVPTDTLPKAKKGSGIDSLVAETQEVENEGLINVNKAGLSELMSLPGIGPALAGRIIDYRNEKGRFERPEDLILVKGIGPAKMRRIRSLISAE